MNVINNIKSLFKQHSYTQEEHFLKDKITMLNVIMLVVGVSIFSFSLLRFFEGDYLQATADILLFTAIVYCAILLAKDKKNLLFISRFLIIAATLMMLIIIVRMETIETRYLWFSILSYLIFYMLGAKEGKIWFTILMLIITLLFLTDIVDMTLISFGVFVVTGSLLAYFFAKFEAIKKKSEELSFNYTRDLNDKVSEKTLELQEQKEILESLFQKSYDGILLIEDAKFVKCNDAILKMLKYENSDELLNANPSKISPKFQPDGRLSSEKADEMINICLSTGAHNFEWVHTKANAKEFWCDITLTHLKIKERDIIHTVIRDISDKKALQEENEKMYQNLESEVQKRTEELQVAMRAKGDFLANMSHEIRTPLNAILGFINILKKDEHNQVRLNHFNTVQSSSQSLLRIINDILDFSKIESNKLDIEEREFNLLKAFEEVKLLFFEKAKEKNISVELNINSEIPEYVLGDIVRVKQIVSNLLSNAIKFTQDKGSIQINIFYKDDYLECRVIDNGIGIEASSLAKIFDSFSQADTSTTRKFGGTGLGLSISKHLAELMKGSINATSIIGKGSTFTFSIKLLHVENYEESTEELVSDIQEYIFDTESKILVVEDNKTNQMLLKMMLLDLGLNCDISENGQEAVERVKNREYDLILMDENMPIMNGIESTKLIRELGFKEMPIVAVTANALNGDREKFLEAGMNDYLSKPIDNKEFNIILNKYLNK